MGHPYLRAIYGTFSLMFQKLKQASVFCSRQAAIEAPTDARCILLARQDAKFCSCIRIYSGMLRYYSLPPAPIGNIMIFRDTATPRVCEAKKVNNYAFCMCKSNTIHAVLFCNLDWSDQGCVFRPFIGNLRSCQVIWMAC